MTDLENMFNRPVSVDFVSKCIERVDPDLWRVLNTKHIDAPGNYYGVKAIANALACAILETASSGSATRVANIAACGGVMQRYDYPTYFVSGPILEAMQRTHPPTDMKWADVVLPYPGLVFMIPCGALFEDSPDRDEIMFLGVAKFKTNEALKVPGRNITVQPWKDQDRITVWWAMQQGTVLQDTTFPTSQPLEPDPKWIDEITTIHEAKHGGGINPDGKRKYIGPTGQYSSMICGIVANLLLLMMARKELIEPGARTKKRLGNGKPIYSPNFIGRKYAIIKQARTSTGDGGHFTELGWRAGHYRRQHFGKDRKDEKLVLIDPYIAFTKGLVK